MVMCYDEHFYGGPPGPISSLSFLEKSMKYAVSVVPKEQVVLGLPFYGRIWASDGSYPNGYALTNTKIAHYINKYDGSVIVDPVSKSTKAVITVDPGDEKPVVGGQVLTAGTYTIWYEGEQSVKSKLELVGKYGHQGHRQLGAGPGDGQYLELLQAVVLNSCTFSDVQYSWARGRHSQRLYEQLGHRHRLGQVFSPTSR